MKKLEFCLLAFILLIAIVLRLYRFDNPIADWHSWRQADTSSVSRNFVEQGFDVLHPRFDDLSNVASGQDNPEGYRYVEFPIYNVLQAGFFKLFDFFTLEEWGRLVTIFSSCLTIVFLYLILLRFRGHRAALFSAFFFAVIPYNIYYGRVILPDPLMTATILGGIYLFDSWLKEKAKIKILNQNFMLALLFTTAAFLLKPYALFFIIPFIASAYNNCGWSFVKRWQLWLFIVIAIFPLIFWRIWILQFPEGIPASNWLFNEGNIRFKGAFFYWIFSRYIGRNILGLWGVILLCTGIIATKHKKEAFIFYSFLLSSLLYVFTIARGNVQHDYYQIIIMPTICIFLGVGADLLLTRRHSVSRIMSIIILVVSTSFMLGFGWFFIRDYFNINNPSIVIAGEAIQKLTPKNAKIIAPYDGDTSFLYQTKRKGWASLEKSFPEMIEMGADYLVLLHPKKEDFTGFGKEYKIVSATSDYILFDLHSK